MPNIQRPEARNFIKKEKLAQVFSCEFCEISKNTFFVEHLRETASKVSQNRRQPLKVFCKKKAFLKILQNPQENAWARVSFLIKLQD